MPCEQWTPVPDWIPIHLILLRNRKRVGDGLTTEKTNPFLFVCRGRGQKRGKMWCKIRFFRISWGTGKWKNWNKELIWTKHGSLSFPRYTHFISSIRVYEKQDGTFLHYFHVALDLLEGMRIGSLQCHARIFKRRWWTGQKQTLELRHISSLSNQELSCGNQREPKSPTHKATHNFPSLFTREIQVAISDKSKWVISLG